MESARRTLGLANPKNLVCQVKEEIATRFVGEQSRQASC